MKRWGFWMVVCLLSCGSVWAQQTAPAPVRADTLPPIRAAADSVPVGKTQQGKLVQQLSDSTTAFSTDTTQLTARQEAAIRQIVPRTATIRSAILPGLGQVYNRQYYKLPFIYGGFAVLGYLFSQYRIMAKQAAIGYETLLYPDSINPVASVPIRVNAFNNHEVLISDKSQAHTVYDLYRRYRDTNLLLMGALWALNIVDANVAAHLKTFDLSDDISMRVQPTVLPGLGFTPGVRVAFTFK